MAECIEMPGASYDGMSVADWLDAMAARSGGIKELGDWVKTLLGYGGAEWDERKRLQEAFARSPRTFDRMLQFAYIGVILTMRCAADEGGMGKALSAVPVRPTDA